MQCKSLVNLTELAYIPLNTSMYRISQSQWSSKIKLAQILAEGLTSILENYQKILNCNCNRLVTFNLIIIMEPLNCYVNISLISLL